MSRVLIVEDEAHIAQGLRFNLEAEGHSVEVAGDGERAIELLLGHKENSKRGNGKRERSQREEFDAVVLDVMLPGKDGFEVATELRAAKNFVPVLMLTARGRPEDVLKGFASGADDYLPKPFELPILLARLQGLLRRRQWMGVSQAAAVTDAFSFDGRTLDFAKLELRVKQQLNPAHIDGSGTAAPPGPQQRPHRLPQSHPRRSLGPPRRHRHPGHRQLHRPPAPLHRGRSRETQAPAHRPRRRLPLRPRTGRTLSRRKADPLAVVSRIGKFTV